MDAESRGRVAWLRFFPLYGPWEDERRLVPSMAGKLLRGECAELSNGEQRRDFLHVEDVARAVCTVAESDLEGVVNIGSGNAPSVAEIARMLAQKIGRPELLKLGVIPYCAGESMHIQADNRKLLSLGWRPNYTLESGLKNAVDWWREHL
jgi:nucleoside-diphosphate-sugar epimerase